jgi:hypothetical protein
MRQKPIRRFNDIVHRALLREIGAADDPLPEHLGDLAEHVSRSAWGRGVFRLGDPVNVRVEEIRRWKGKVELSLGAH